MDPFNQDRDVREIADRHGIIYMAYSSLGTQWSQKLGQNPVLTSPELQEISQKHDVSIAQVVTSWVLQTGAVAIPRSSNSSHIIELKIFLRNPGKLTVFLDDEDMERIASLNGALGALWE
jgi:diketogulonate reductase-like aldo/keto reductase